MNKILFPTDFSANAKNVFHFALDLAKKNKSSLTVFHAYGLPSLDDALSRDFYSRGTLAMKALADFVADNRPKEMDMVEVTTLAEIGFAKDAILKIADEEEFDIIVMGMQGLSNSFNNFFGKVSLSVMESANIPVILIPKGFRYRPINKIVYTMDFKFFELPLINALVRFCKKLRWNMTCLHVLENDDSGDQIEEAMEAISMLYNGHKNLSGVVNFDLIEGDLENSIEEYIVNEDIDLVVMLSKNKKWKFRIIEGSHSREIAKRISIPLMVIKRSSFISSYFILQ